MAYNPRPVKAEVISHGKWVLLQAQAEAKKEQVKLKPIHLPSAPMSNKLEYYIELWKMGTPSDKIISSMLNTANLKHIIGLVLKANYSILYIRRTHDSKVIWDQR